MPLTIAHDRTITLPLRCEAPATLRVVQVLEEFLEKQCVNIKEQPGLLKDEFKARISFHTGPYNSPGSFQSLAAELAKLEGGSPSNRLYFLSVPPPVFGAVLY